MLMPNASFPSARLGPSDPADGIRAPGAGGQEEPPAAESVQGGVGGQPPEERGCHALRRQRLQRRPGLQGDAREDGEQERGRVRGRAHAHEDQEAEGEVE